MSPVALPQDFEYALLPMWAFGSKQLVGQGMARYNWHPETGVFKRIRSTLAMQQYTNFSRFAIAETAPVMRLQLQALLRDPLNSIRRRELQIGMEQLPFTPFSVVPQGPIALNQIFIPQSQILYLFEASYGESYRLLTKPWSWQLAAELGRLELATAVNGRISGEINHRWFYQTQKRRSYLDQRFFAGAAFINDVQNPVGFRSQGGAVNGESDYGYDHIFFRRAPAFQQATFQSNQVMLRDAGMRSVMHPLVLNQLQQDPQSWMLAYNLAIKVPRVPLEVYANASLTNRSAQIFTYFGSDEILRVQPNVTNVLAEGGVAFVLMGGAFKVNFNALQSPLLRPNAYDLSRNPKWFEYLSWSFDLKKLNPYDLVRELKF